MAIFKAQKNTETTAVAPKAQAVSMAKHPTEVILSPRITEKAAYLAESNAYVFNIAKNATKTEVAAAIKALFKVEPRSVRTIRTEGKAVFNRRTRAVGRTVSQKKAIVFLKKGDTIDIA
ncbi:MAG TPA: 50S ribosomal protein L23 [Candidatus Paceibacterota bacterium]